MVKKAMLLVIALGMLALPAVAHGAELKENGVALEVNSEITLTSTNFETTTALGGVACELVTIHAKVLKNGPSVEFEPTLATPGKCALTSPVVEVKLTNLEFIQFVLAGGAGLSAITFKADIPAAGLVNCHLVGPIGVTYVPGSNVLTIPGSSVVPGIGVPPGCPSEGVVHGSFSVETANGAAVTIS